MTDVIKWCGFGLGCTLKHFRMMPPPKTTAYAILSFSLQTSVYLYIVECSDLSGRISTRYFWPSNGSISQVFRWRRLKCHVDLWCNYGSSLEIQQVLFHSDHLQRWLYSDTKILNSFCFVICSWSGFENKICASFWCLFLDVSCIV